MSDAEELCKHFGKALDDVEVKTLVVEVHLTHAQDSDDAIYVWNRISRMLLWNVSR